MLSCEFALPNSYDCPPSFLKSGSYLFVSINIPLSLLCPVLGIICWTCVAAVMSMPEATIHKDGNALFKKDEIRMSFYLIAMSPSRDMIRFEVLNQFQLRALRILTLNSAHH